MKSRSRPVAAITYFWWIVFAQEIIDDLEAALEQFSKITDDLKN